MNTSYHIEINNTYRRTLFVKTTSKVGEESVLDALLDAGLSSEIETIQCVGGRLEVCFKTETTKVSVLNNGLLLADSTRVLFKDPLNRCLLATVCGVPPEVGTDQLLPIMRTFGNVISFYDVFKEKRGIQYKNGNRVFKFRYLDKLLPDQITINNRPVRIRYTKNPEFYSPALTNSILQPTIPPNTINQNTITTNLSKPNQHIQSTPTQSTPNQPTSNQPTSDQPQPTTNKNTDQRPITTTNNNKVNNEWQTVKRKTNQRKNTPEDQPNNFPPFSKNTKDNTTKNIITNKANTTITKTNQEYPPDKSNIQPNHNKTIKPKNPPIQFPQTQEETPTSSENTTTQNTPPKTNHKRKMNTTHSISQTPTPTHSTPITPNQGENSSPIPKNINIGEASPIQASSQIPEILSKDLEPNSQNYTDNLSPPVVTPKIPNNASDFLHTIHLEKNKNKLGPLLFFLHTEYKTWATLLHEAFKLKYPNKNLVGLLPRIITSEQLPPHHNTTYKLRTITNALTNARLNQKNSTKPTDLNTDAKNRFLKNNRKNFIDHNIYYESEN